MLTRHKMYSIKDIVHDKKDWVEQYNEVPYDYWKRRWDFLCRRLMNYSDMEKDLRYQKYKSLKEEPQGEEK